MWEIWQRVRWKKVLVLGVWLVATYTGQCLHKVVWRWILFLGHLPRRRRDRQLWLRPKTATMVFEGSPICMQHIRINRINRCHMVEHVCIRDGRTWNYGMLLVCAQRFMLAPSSISRWCGGVCGLPETECIHTRVSLRGNWRDRQILRMWQMLGHARAYEGLHPFLLFIGHSPSKQRQISNNKAVDWSQD